METNKYSVTLYTKFQTIIDMIEQEFFLSKGKKAFPKIVLALNNRCSSCVVAFVAPDYLFDKKDEEKVQYLAINPKYMQRDISDIVSTLCHELCHVYEVAYIHIPRGGYHTKAWCDLMRECGLEPVFNNKSKTSVTHKIIEGGAFEEFCKKFDNDFFSIVEYSQDMSSSGSEGGADNADKPVKKYNRNKIKYVCPECDAHVWGKAGLNIYCNDCECSFEEEENEEGN